ncbi:MAG: L,D-transpeptidase family protein [Lachnospiraceae bacterium]
MTYQMGCGITETLDAQTTAGWFTFDENIQPVLDETAASAWVDALADRYDTLGTQEPFRTTNGETVYVEARTYGWQMDRETEKAALIDILKNGESTEHTVTWLEGAWTRGENDIGDTYVEIDYTNQHMWFYKDGALLVDTAVVTGNVSAGNASPEGIFCLVGKSEHETLKGEGYSTPVDYWMPFYGGVGIHDADSWRSVYGGTIYQNSGSHGCINTPTAKVAVIYENIEAGTPIVCYSSGINYGYPEESGGGQSQTETPAQSESQSQTDGQGGTNSDIIIIGGTEQGVTQDGVPYTGQDLQNIVIQ